MRSFLFCCLMLMPLIAVAASQSPAPGTQPGKTRLFSDNGQGRGTYSPWSERGDTLPDFSHCGYGGGGKALPSAVVRETLSPAADSTDDGPRIQEALDRVSRLPLGPDGLRGAVLLSRGSYRCGSILRIAASGVVLRGEGDGDDAKTTRIVAIARRQQPLLVISGMRSPKPVSSPSPEIIDDYVPVGTRRFRVGNATALSVGQPVYVVRRGNAAWISAIGMDRIAVRPSEPKSTQQWKPFDLRFDRVITAIEGDLVSIDSPLGCALDKRWGGGAVVPIDEGDRIQNCGVEALRAVSIYDETETAKEAGEKVWIDEDHATHLVEFAAVKNAWARGLTTQYFYHGPAKMESSSKWITVEDCRSLDPVSLITGGRRYPYHIEGQLVLVQRCTSDRARHAFVFGARVPGPNVFLECRSTHDYATSEPHHRWSVSGLYDNVEADLAFQDRQWMGSGHGWSGANYVAWNCRGTLICQQPPTAQNFAIGFVGRRGKDAFPHKPTGWWESEGTPVTPRSLYQQQLHDRLNAARD